MIKYPILPAALLSLSQPVLANCDYATDLLEQAYDLHAQGNAVDTEKRLVTKALRHCPQMPYAHNYLASLLEDERNYPQAVYHYKQALKIKPDFSEAWYGLGETYYKQDQFPLSLEAHLHACQTDKDSKQRITELLKNNRFAVTEAGQILNKESLLLLYDKRKQQRIADMISDCGLRGFVVVPSAVFRNFSFDTGKASLQPGSERQMDELAAALRQLSPPVIDIQGHTDNQRFRHQSQAESDRLNQKLSEQRAATVAKALEQRGVSSSRIQSQGFGPSKPAQGYSSADWDKNRRVEIKVN